MAMDHEIWSIHFGEPRRPAGITPSTHMNADYLFQSIPPNCNLLDAAKKKPVYGEFLELFGFGEISFEALKFRAGDGDFAEYAGEAKRLREMHPGLEIRRFELGTEHEGLREHLLNAENSVLLRAIDGGDILGLSICSTRGEPVRFLPPYMVKQIAGEFDRLGSEALAGESTSPGILQAYRRLGDFYRFSAAFDEGVIRIRL